MRTARRTLLTRDWMLAAVAVVLAMLVCILLGMWQYHRFEAKQARRDLIETNYSATPTDLGSVLPQRDSDLASQDQWRTVRLAGRYCTAPDCVLYVRNRPRDGQVGFWQLVPFETDQGTLLVVRGWVPMQETKSDPLDPPAVPEGERTIVVHMRPDEPLLAGRTDPPGQVQTVTPSDIVGRIPVGSTVRTGGYGELVRESPSAERPRPLEEPDTSLGPHLSYAVQWWVFAIFFPVAWVVRARRAVLDARGEDGDPSQGGSDGGDEARVGGSRAVTAARPRSSSALRRDRARTRDEEEEDAILEDRRT